MTVSLLIKACPWCGEPATKDLVDRQYVCTKSGGMFKRGTGMRFRACADCAERIQRRYLDTAKHSDQRAA
jgi:hypothetical protein